MSMELKDLVIPAVLRDNKDPHIVAFEGCHACGKSSLCAQLKKEPQIRFVEIPGAYMSPGFKDYLYLSTSPVSSALIFAASLVDRMEEIRKQSGSYIFIQDRSLWSTVAINWVKNTGCAQTALDIFAVIHQYLPIPSRVFVLDVSYKTCISRIRSRDISEQKFDVMPLEEYNRNREFYNWLSIKDAGVEILKTDGKSLVEISRDIITMLKTGR